MDANPLIPIDAATAPTGGTCADLRGIEPMNLVNRTLDNSGGLQLELHKGFRDDLTNAASSFDALRDIVYTAVNESMTADSGKNRRAQVTSQ
jgi:phage replication-related protein YjqB (UPF0714/DUF867 family)